MEDKKQPEDRERDARIAVGAEGWRYYRSTIKGRHTFVYTGLASPEELERWSKQPADPDSPTMEVETSERADAFGDVPLNRVNPPHYSTDMNAAMRAANAIGLFQQYKADLSCTDCGWKTEVLWTWFVNFYLPGNSSPQMPQGETEALAVVAALDIVITHRAQEGAKTT